jgi:hypothetical protein
MTGAPIRANSESLRTGHRAKSRPISFPGETIMARITDIERPTLEGTVE